MVPKASSDGGQRIPDVVLGKPLLAPSPSVCTQTFLFFYTDSKEQRDNICRYVQTKFFRFLVSTRKMTQHAPVEAYKWVPQQDFTADSDINWQQPIAAIDQQLYAKYQLSSEEVALIEARVKPMALD